MRIPQSFRCAAAPHPPPPAPPICHRLCRRRSHSRSSAKPSCACVSKAPAVAASRGGLSPSLFSRCSVSALGRRFRSSRGQSKWRSERRAALGVGAEDDGAGDTRGEQRTARQRKRFMRGWWFCGEAVRATGHPGVPGRDGGRPAGYASREHPCGDSVCVRWMHEQENIRLRAYCQRVGLRLHIHSIMHSWQQSQKLKHNAPGPDAGRHGSPIHPSIHLPYMKDRRSSGGGGDRFAVFPFSMGCMSQSAVSVADPSEKKAQAQAQGDPSSSSSSATGAATAAHQAGSSSSEEGVKAAAATPGLVAAGVSRLMKGIRSLSHMFAAYDGEEEDEEEREMVIGYPTDVQHVGHIGWDGRNSTVGAGAAMASMVNAFSLPSSLSLHHLDMAMDRAAAHASA